MSKMKPGRKPKPGERYPSGKLKPAGPAPALVRRMVDSATAGASDPLLATPLGWLLLDKTLTSVQVSAGLEYAMIRERYDQAMSFKSRNAQSPAYQIGSANAVEEVECDDDVERINRHIRNFVELENFVARGRNTRTIAVLDRVCIEHLKPPLFEIEILAGALNRIAVHLHLVA